MSHGVRPERRTTFGKEQWKFDAAGQLLSGGARELSWHAKTFSVDTSCLGSIGN
jgi:hypothetical protein